MKNQRKSGKRNDSVVAVEIDESQARPKAAKRQRLCADLSGCDSLTEEEFKTASFKLRVEFWKSKQKSKLVKRVMDATFSRRHWWITATCIRGGGNISLFSSLTMGECDHIRTCVFIFMCLWFRKLITPSNICSSLTSWLCSLLPQSRERAPMGGGYRLYFECYCISPRKSTHNIQPPWLTESMSQSLPYDVKALLSDSGYDWTSLSSFSFIENLRQWWSWMARLLSWWENGNSGRSWPMERGRLPPAKF